MTNALSVKSRLKKLQDDGISMQDALISYGLERTIYRISISPYVERFTLKGGIFLYALFEGHYARATSDIDLLAQSISNDKYEMKQIFMEILSIETDDALRFALDTLDIYDITEFKEYHGVKVSVMAFLDRTKVPISIDIGFGDVVYPERVKMEFPVMLGMDVPKIYAYTKIPHNLSGTTYRAYTCDVSTICGTSGKRSKINAFPLFFCFGILPILFTNLIFDAKIMSTLN